CVLRRFACCLISDTPTADVHTLSLHDALPILITTLVLLGQVLELRARERTSGAIKALLNLAPKTARRIADDGSEEEVALELVVEIGRAHSELQSRENLVCRLLLEKKKQTTREH